MPKPLKPCPFCAAERIVELWVRFDAGHVSHLHCEACGADGPSIYSEYGPKIAMARARAAWNGRGVALPRRDTEGAI
jgi:hypothetical protein